MPLPKLKYPTFFDKIPSTKESVEYRPFLVKEQKVLLIASESGDQKSIKEAMKKTLQACIISKINIDELATFDIEYLFLRIRSKSISEKLEIVFSHVGAVNKKGESCEHKTKVSVDLDPVTVQFDSEHSSIINVSDSVTLKMRYPNIDSSDTLGIDNNAGNVFDLVGKCISVISVGEETFNSDDYTTEEMREFLEQFTTPEFKKVERFFETMPKLKHKISYKCGACLQEDEYTLEGLSDFF
jgi:hypothetical protein